MKVMKTLLVIGSLMASFAPKAEVTVNFHSDISPLLVGGKEVGYLFYASSTYTIPDGTNQVVLRVSKLVDKLGEKEKFNSKVFVLTFDGENEEIFIKPDAKVMRVAQAKAFNQSPKFSIKDSSGKEIKYELAELPNLGGITRDYDKELTNFNLKHYPELTLDSANTSTSNLISQESNSANSKNPSASELSMFEYWLRQASATELDQFADIAFAGRKEDVIIIPVEASQSVQMLGYWLNKASEEERKKILAYLITR